jgi:UDP-N-acetylenolpyruvoylglucosamine reductase
VNTSNAIKKGIAKRQPPAALAERLSSASILRFDEPLAKRTTLRVGGPAEWFLEPAHETDLAMALRFCAEQDIPFMALGRGSNLLIRDGGIRGLVISLAHPEFAGIRVQGERLQCGAGAKLKQVSVEARRNGIAGMEFLEGIPGSIGGALRMNAGAMGRCMFDVVERIRMIDGCGNIHECCAGEVPAGYRNCALLKTHIALGAVLQGNPAPTGEIHSRMTAFSRKRWESQPAAASAGCMFKNPPAVAAGKLIDELGLKGMRVGGAVVSDVHGNFIVNEGSATARDVLALIDLIQQRARSERGIELETEVQIVGEE